MIRVFICNRVRLPGCYADRSLNTRATNTNTGPSIVVEQTSPRVVPHYERNLQAPKPCKRRYPLRKLSRSLDPFRYNMLFSRVLLVIKRANLVNTCDPPRSEGGAFIRLLPRFNPDPSDYGNLLDWVMGDTLVSLHPCLGVSACLMSSISVSRSDTFYLRMLIHCLTLTELKCCFFNGEAPKAIIRKK